MLAYPSIWLERICVIAGPVTLDVAGYATHVDITTDQLERVYFPLLALLDERAADQRVIAGLAGVPGSGKSTFAGSLAHVANHVLRPSRLAVVGIDGWHYPNSILDQRTTTNAAGQPVPLSQRKGGPESFDVAALAEALQRLTSTDTAIRLPVYDRRRHEPVPDGLSVSPEVRIVLLEGNYLLSDAPPWDAVRSMLMPTLFLASEQTLARERVIARHIRGGCTPTQADAKYACNDQLNAKIVQATAGQADFIVQLDPAPGIRRVRPNEDSVSGTFLLE